MRGRWRSVSATTGGKNREASVARDEHHERGEKRETKKVVVGRREICKRKREERKRKKESRKSVKIEGKERDGTSKRRG